MSRPMPAMRRVLSQTGSRLGYSAHADASWTRSRVGLGVVVYDGDQILRYIKRTTIAPSVDVAEAFAVMLAVQTLLTDFGEVTAPIFTDNRSVAECSSGTRLRTLEPQWREVIRAVDVRWVRRSNPKQSRADIAARFARTQPPNFSSLWNPDHFDYSQLLAQ